MEVKQKDTMYIRAHRFPWKSGCGEHMARGLSVSQDLGKNSERSLGRGCGLPHAADVRQGDGRGAWLHLTPPRVITKAKVLGGGPNSESREDGAQMYSNCVLPIRTIKVNSPCKEHRETCQCLNMDFFCAFGNVSSGSLVWQTLSSPNLKGV